MFSRFKRPFARRGISHEGKGFRVIMIFIFLAAAMETDIYLPAFPDILHALHTNESMVQRILSINFIGVCIGSLLYGPLSDHFGRKPVLMFGFSLFTLASVGCVFALSIEQLLLFRLIQGFGSAACIIVGTAMIFDLFEEEQAAKMVSDLNTLVVSLIALAPLIGGWINVNWGYQASFVFIAGLVLVSALKCWWFIPESLAVSKRKKLKPVTVMYDYKQVLSTSAFWYNTLATSLMLSAYLVFVSNMSLLFINELHVVKAHFPYFQIAILGTFVLVSINNGRLIDKWGMEGLKYFGLLVITGAAVLFLFSTEQQLASPFYLTAVMCLFSVGAGCSIGIFFTQSMQACPDLTGIAASLVTAIRLCIVAVAIDFSSAQYDGSATSVVLSVAVFVALLVLVCFVHVSHIRWQRRRIK
ncbi:multidrug effflux MFS transporter [uncultured Shewanella sp.]|uniref:multidrug effflux MFS transporter n=1 Tax=uncultured Shewanella sp. TaxID=173975 RepID=UPI00260F2365|nr:multidrug effflux MFS transporter [uncultured Shewanella sp.]